MTCKHCKKNKIKFLIEEGITNNALLKEQQVSGKVSSLVSTAITNKYGTQIKKTTVKNAEEMYKFLVKNDDVPDGIITEIRARNNKLGKKIADDKKLIRSIIDKAVVPSVKTKNKVVESEIQKLHDSFVSVVATYSKACSFVAHGICFEVAKNICVAKIDSIDKRLVDIFDKAGTRIKKTTPKDGTRQLPLKSKAAGSEDGTRQLPDETSAAQASSLPFPLRKKYDKTVLRELDASGLPSMISVPVKRSGSGGVSPQNIADLALDVVGFIEVPIGLTPVTLGMVADTAHALWYAQRRDVVGFACSLIGAAIPVIGDSIKFFKYAKYIPLNVAEKIVKNSDEIIEAARFAASKTDNPVAKQTAARLIKEFEELKALASKGPDGLREAAARFQKMWKEGGVNLAQQQTLRKRAAQAASTTVKQYLPSKAAAGVRSLTALLRGAKYTRNTFLFQFAVYYVLNYTKVGESILKAVVEYGVKPALKSSVEVVAHLIKLIKEESLKDIEAELRKLKIPESNIREFALVVQNYVKDQEEGFKNLKFGPKCPAGSKEFPYAPDPKSALYNYFRSGFCLDPSTNKIVSGLTAYTKNVKKKSDNQQATDADYKKLQEVRILIKEVGPAQRLAMVQTIDAANNIITKTLRPALKTSAAVDAVFMGKSPFTPRFFADLEQEIRVKIINNSTIKNKEGAINLIYADLKKQAKRIMDTGNKPTYQKTAINTSVERFLTGDGQTLLNNAKSLDAAAARKPSVIVNIPPKPPKPKSVEPTAPVGPSTTPKVPDTPAAAKGSTAKPVLGVVAKYYGIPMGCYVAGVLVVGVAELEAAMKTIVGVGAVGAVLSSLVRYFASYKGAKAGADAQKTSALKKFKSDLERIGAKTTSENLKLISKNAFIGLACYASAKEGVKDMVLASGVGAGIASMNRFFKQRGEKFNLTNKEIEDLKLDAERTLVPKIDPESPISSTILASVVRTTVAPSVAAAKFFMIGNDEFDNAFDDYVDLSNAIDKAGEVASKGIEGAKGIAADPSKQSVMELFSALEKEIPEGAKRRVSFVFRTFYADYITNREKINKFSIQLGEKVITGPQVFLTCLISNAVKSEKIVETIFNFLIKKSVTLNYYINSKEVKKAQRNRFIKKLLKFFGMENLPEEAQKEMSDIIVKTTQFLKENKDDLDDIITLCRAKDRMGKMDMESGLKTGQTLDDYLKQEKERRKEAAKTADVTKNPFKVGDEVTFTKLTDEGEEKGNRVYTVTKIVGAKAIKIEGSNKVFAIKSKAGKFEKRD